MTSIQLGYLGHLENVRSNQAREAENYRHNYTVEGETYRHNVATETVENARLDETIRHNKAYINELYAELGEKRRSNKVYEGLESKRVGNESAIRHFNNIYTQAKTDREFAEVGLIDYKKDNLKASTDFYGTQTALGWTNVILGGVSKVASLGAGGNMNPIGF